MYGDFNHYPDCTCCLSEAFYGLFKYKNIPAKPDYFEYYKTQDTVPEGKVGIFATGLIMPTEHSHAFFHNIIHKILNVVIPWPINLLSLKDRGIALLDPAHVHAREEFTPTHLKIPLEVTETWTAFPIWKNTNRER